MGRRYPHGRGGRPITLDAGALIAFERGDQAIRTVLEGMERLGAPIIVPSAALAQVWRNGARQARLARLIGSDRVVVEVLDEARARAVGEVCGLRGVSDVVDAFVAVTARKYGGIVVTSDPDDLRRIDPTLDVRPAPT